MVAADDTQDPATAEDASGALSAAELRARICAAVDAVQELERERCALEEVRDSLTAKQRDLTKQRDESRVGEAALEQELAAARGRLEELEREIATTEADARLLERRCARATVRARELAREADAIAGEIDDGTEGADVAEDALVEAGETIRRLGHKLSFQGRKFEGHEPAEAERSEVDELLGDLAEEGTEPR